MYLSFEPSRSGCRTLVNLFVIKQTCAPESRKAQTLWLSPANHITTLSASITLETKGLDLVFSELPFFSLSRDRVGFLVLEELKSLLFFKGLGHLLFRLVTNLEKCDSGQERLR